MANDMIGTYSVCDRRTRRKPIMANTNGTKTRKARQKHRQNATTGTPKLRPMEKPNSTSDIAIVGRTKAMDLQVLNKQRLDEITNGGMSHGLEVLISRIKQAQQLWLRGLSQVNSEHFYFNVRAIVIVYFSWVTDNRLMAHIIVDNELYRLVIPEAGHRLYANYKDGYQANGGGYNKPDHILDAMIHQVKKHMDVNTGVSHWQDFIKASIIS